MHLDLESLNVSVNPVSYGSPNGKKKTNRPTSDEFLSNERRGQFISEGNFMGAKFRPHRSLNP